MEAVKSVGSSGRSQKERSLGEESGGDEPPGGLNNVFRAISLEGYLGIERIYVDYEGINPTGTHKDRIARVHVERAVRGGFSGITVGTCGNYGASIAYHSMIAGIKAVVFVPSGYSLERLYEIRTFGAEVVEIRGTYEEAVRASRRFASENGFYDANPGSRREVDFEAYSSLAGEVLERVEPDVVFVPVGNGTTLAGLWRGFRRRGVEPRMVGVTTSFGNEVLRRFYGDPNVDFAETVLNEPLVSSESFDADEALRAVYESGGYVFGFADDVALRYAGILHSKTHISPLPASALTLAGLVKFVRKFGVGRKNFLLIVTGGVSNGTGPDTYGRALHDVRWKDGPRTRSVFQEV